MPKLNFELSHDHTKDEVKSRLERFAEALQSKYKDQVGDLQQSWAGDTMSFGFKTMGVKLAGDMIVHDDKLVVDGDLPFAAMMFKGKIESEMREQLGRLLR